MWKNVQPVNGKKNAGDDGKEYFGVPSVVLLTFLSQWQCVRVLRTCVRTGVRGRPEWSWEDECCVVLHYFRPGTKKKMGLVQSRGTNENDGSTRETFAGSIKSAGQPYSLGMGSLGGPHARSGSVRSAPRLPMPDAHELERRFTKVLVSDVDHYFPLSLYQSRPLLYNQRSFSMSYLILPQMRLPGPPSSPHFSLHQLCLVATACYITKKNLWKTYFAWNCQELFQKYASTWNNVYYTRWTVFKELTQHL